MGETMPPKSHRDQVIEECRRIETLARALARSASRRFATPVDAEDFETGEGPDYSNAIRTLRIRMERIAQSLEGIDAQLDEDLSEYTLGVLRANPRAVRPRFFQGVN
jgi:hypothetical protein